MEKSRKQSGSKADRIKELVEVLNHASKAYYQESREIMTNHEYDALYDELVSLEKETGIVLSGSPTVNVGYEVLSNLPKEKHPSKMLSLDKTKDAEQLASWLGDKEGLLSWKLDGLTVVLTYEEGKLSKAVTRGNGEIGEVVTSNARVFANLPLNIDFKGRLVLRGEAVISYDDFEKINSEIDDEGAKYKNPRNLCSGSVRQLDNRVTAERNVRFYAFALVSAEGMTFNARSRQMEWLADQGFECVTWRKVHGGDEIPSTVEWFAQHIAENPIPSDGLVLIYDDIEYGLSLGTTAKFPRDSIAFKWKDEIKETTLKEIEWSASRTGLINPVAIFEPVELEGTTVSRASVHNISVMRELALGIGDKIKVYKANMIIPQIAENITKSNNVEIPDRCPVCGGKTTVKEENGVKTLNCINPECLAKHIKRLTLFVSRDAMNIEGLSEATIEKFVAEGMIKELADVFRLERFRERIVEMEGFGEKSFENLIASVNKARKTTPERLLYGLGIPGIGKANARLIARACGGSWEEIQSLDEDRLVAIEGIGDIMAAGFVKFFREQKNTESVKDILREVTLDETIEKTGSTLTGKTFVITGSLEHFANRDELKDRIEKAGGKVAGSVSSKTSYLINNDLLSTSGKNKKAKELGIEIIDEETIMAWLK
ncbi:MAG: NAD-dependent DNA ligase LigA [Candidatus Fimisoma sp.]|nr:NAD-dependent DNA ligase LigA [Candidatus Fimisoma sp.]